MVHVQQVEKSKKRKHTREGNRSRQAEENYSRKSSTKIRDKSRFMKGLSHQGESSSSKDRYDRNKCGKLHGGECMMGTNACYRCGKPGHMVKDCPNRRNQEQGKKRVQTNSPSEEVQ